VVVFIEAIKDNLPDEAKFNESPPKLQVVPNSKRARLKRLDSISDQDFIEQNLGLILGDICKECVVGKNLRDYQIFIESFFLSKQTKDLQQFDTEALLINEQHFLEFNSEFTKALIAYGVLDFCCAHMKEELLRHELITVTEANMMIALEGSDSLSKLTMMFSICKACHGEEIRQPFMAIFRNLLVQQFNDFQPKEEKLVRSEPSKLRHLEQKERNHARTFSEPRLERAKTFHLHKLTQTRVPVLQSVTVVRKSIAWEFWERQLPSPSKKEPTTNLLVPTYQDFIRFLY
jgi:hypothetical protein